MPWRRRWSAGVSRGLNCGGRRSREKAGAGGGMLEHIEIANPYGPNTRLQRLRGGAQLGGHATSRNAALNHCFDFSGRKGGLGDAFDRHTGHGGYEEQLLRIEGRGNGGGGLVGVDVERPHRRRKRWSDRRYH